VRHREKKGWAYRAAEYEVEVDLWTAICVLLIPVEVGVLLLDYVYGASPGRVTGRNDRAAGTGKGVEQLQLLQFRNMLDRGIIGVVTSAVKRIFGQN
jgi:hypothetical protein